MFGVLTGCKDDTIEPRDYKGKPLIIGVIGEPPEVRGNNVNFEKITFNRLMELQSPLDYDAVFITKENLSEAADRKYARAYKTSGIPFFFIESKKSYIPFTQEELSYEEAPDVLSDMHVTGYFQEGEQFRSWGYGLYNDKLNEANIKNVYIRIFETVESLSTR